MPALNCHPLTVDFDLAVHHGMGVVEACRYLVAQGVRPDVICGHSGWGELLFVKDVFPDTPILSYFEFYYHFSHVDVGFDPEFPSSPEDSFRLRARNAVGLLTFDAIDWGNAPTVWQRAVHPPELRSRISVLHEGVDTDVVRPDPSAWLFLERDGLRLSAGDEVVTYVARNLEPYRGFHTFMRAAREVLRRRPRTHILIVGGDGVSYGAPPPGRTTWRQLLLEETGLATELRLHFLGQIPHEAYVKMLQVSAVHVYLTYPFVLSWSFIEAMSAGCAIVGSDTPPVMEVLRDGENGLAVDFFSPRAIADRIDEILGSPRSPRGSAGRSAGDRCPRVRPEHQGIAPLDRPPRRSDGRPAAGDHAGPATPAGLEARQEGGAGLRLSASNGPQFSRDGRPPPDWVWRPARRATSIGRKRSSPGLSRWIPSM